MNPAIHTALLACVIANSATAANATSSGGDIPMPVVIAVLVVMGAVLAALIVALIAEFRR